MKLWEVGSQNWELYIWKDLKTRETKGLSFSSEGKKKKALQESKPQDYNSLFLHPHSWETPDLESNRSIIPQAVILMRQKAEANEKLLWRDRCFHIPKYHGIFTEKKKKLQALLIMSSQPKMSKPLSEQSNLFRSAHTTNTILELHIYRER